MSALDYQPPGRRCTAASALPPIAAAGVAPGAVGRDALGISVCAVIEAGSAESLAISLFTKSRNSELNGAPGCESLLVMYSIFGPTSLCDPIPPKVIHGFGL